ncbi:uracil-DNA glycosylase [Nocardioides panaciterrulae]|uniref:Uracil-DNA glycosylase n=1 Tax=Nocardioides panaciterrulae TaxID=661492 RepID=A0A7Y9E8M0_9ACTN|nr:uracil-DNA glycosylase [Nocardioides panaciterrulae]NYD43228.1 uracil-DNA glycosylase [Nocardioides panaciterrulae]
MNDERLRCAESALRTVPEDYRTVNAADVADQERGHSFHQGMHIGWAWGEDERGRPYLDFLSEHRHPGMQAGRYFADGTTEPIATPASAREVSPDPVEDAELERHFFEHNRVAYADLRDRGLLPAVGENVGLQDINEYLLKGGSPTSGSEPDADSNVAGAHGVRLGGGWDEPLRDELAKPYWSKLLEFVTYERENYEVYPPRAQTFEAFELTPYDDVKVVILGQDPYIKPGQAHGLAFSVPTGITIPPSLRNIRKELAADLEISLSDLPDHGDLTAWAEQGVLLLNTTLTVRRGKSNSHEGMGWETFTDGVISAISAGLKGVVFILWGGPAQKKAKLIDLTRHPAPIKAAHPKARANAHNPLAGSKPFTTANKLLASAGRAPVDWSLLDRTPQDE